MTFRGPEAHDYGPSQSHSRRSWRLTFAVALIGFLAATSASLSQVDVYWRTDNGTTNWSEAGDIWPWFYEGWDETWQKNINAGSPATTNWVKFNINQGTDTSVNGGWWAMRGLDIMAAASDARTYNQSGDSGLSFNHTDAGSTGIFINSSGDQTFNVRIAFDANGTVRGNSGSSSISFTTNFFLNNKTVTFGGDSSSTTISLSGEVSGTNGTIVKTNANTMILSASNTYTGTTTVGGGVLRIANSNALGTTAGATTVNSGAALQLSNNITTAAEGLTLNGTGVSSDGALRSVHGDNNYAGAITLGSATRINSDTGTLTLSGGISGAQNLTIGGAGNTAVSSVIGTSTGTLTKDGDGILTLSAANTYTGGTLISAGTLRLGAGAGAGSLSTGNITNNATFLIDRTGDITVANAISGNGVLNKAGAGTLALSGNNSYTGATTISNGAVRISHANALGTTAAGTTVVSGAALEVSGGITTAAEALSLSGTGISSGGALRNISGNNAYAGAITLGSAARINSDSDTLTLSGGIGGTQNLTIGGAGHTTVSSVIGTSTGTLTKDGAGTLTLTAANTYSGGTLISAGTLQLGNGSTTGSLSTGNITNNATFLINRSDNITVNNAISGTGALNKTGAGTLSLSGNSSYSGATAISNGAVRISHANALGTTAAGTTVSTGAALELSGGITTAAEALSLSGTGIGTAGALRNISGNNTYAGTITLGAAARINSDSGTLTLDVASGNTITGTQNLNFGGAGNITVNDAMNISTGTLTKDGAGTLTIAGTQSYTGATTVSAGTLAVTGTSTGSAVSVNSGGTLSGTGTLGAVTIASGGTLNPGSSPGTLSVGNLTWEGGGNYNWQVYDAAGAAGTGYDTISGNSLNITATEGTKFKINLWSLSGISPDVSGSAINFTNTNNYTWTLGSFTNGITNFATNLFSINTGATNGAAGFANTFSGAFSIYTTNSTNLVLAYTAASSVYDVTVAAGATNQGAATGGTNLFTGASALNKLGAGTLIMTNPLNDYTGVTTVQEGTLQVNVNAPSGSAGALGNAISAVLVGDSSTNLAAGFNIGVANVTNSRDLTVVTGTGAADRIIGTTITSGQAVQAGGITFNTNTVLNAASGGTMLYSGLLTGSGNLTISNSGTSVFSASNNYTGTTTVLNGSTLRIANNNALGGTGSGATVNSGGTLALSNGITSAEALTLNGTGVGSGGALRNVSGNNTASGVITLGAASRINADTGLLTLSGGINGANFGLTAGGSGNMAISGAITNSTGLLTKDGSGTLTLTGANTYSGGTLVGAGTLAGNTTGLQGTITNNSLVIFDQSADGTYSSVLSGTGALIKTNAGVLTLTGANTQSGGTTIGQGTLSIGSGGATGSLAGAITNNATLLYNRTGELTQATVISGSGALNKAGSGTLTLSQANTYTGATTISNGAIRISNATGLGTTAAGTTVISGAALELTGGITVGAESLALNGSGISSGGALRNISGNNAYGGAITMGSSSTIASDSGTLTVSGAIGGNHTLTILGAGNVTLSGIYSSSAGTGLLVGTSGTLTLSGANTFGGNMTISNGATVVAANNTALGGTGSPTTLESGATLAFSNGISSAEALTIAGTGVGGNGALRNISGANTNTGTVTLSANATIAADANTSLRLGTVDITGANNRSVTFAGAGTNILAGGISTFGGSLTNRIIKDGSGVLVVSNNGTTGTGQLRLASGTVVVAAGSLTTSENTGTRAIDIGLSGDATGTNTAANAALLVRSGLTNSNSIYIAPSGGDGSFTRTVGTDSESGTVVFNKQMYLGHDVYLTSAGTANVNYSGNITNDGTLNIYKVGAGSLTLSGNNTWAGGLVVSNGTVIVSGGNGITDGNSVNLAASGAALNLGAGETIGSLAGVTGSTVSLGVNDLVTVGNNTSTVFAGVISGSAGGEIIKAGNGTLTLAGVNTYVGDTFVNAGTLAFSNGSVNNSTIRLGPDGSSGDATILLLDSDGGTSASSTLVIRAGGGTRTLASSNATGVNSFGGGIFLDGAGVISQLGAGTFGLGGTVLDAKNQNLTLTAVTNGNLIISNIVTNSVTDGGSITKTGTGTVTYAGSGANTYTRTNFVNEGTLVLAKTGGVNAVAGAVAIANGATLRLGASGQIDSTFVTNASGGIFDLNGFNTTAAVAGAGNITLGAGTLTLSPTGTDVISGVISGDGGIIKTNSGTQTLSGANTYTGETRVSQGTLALNANNVIGDSSAVTINGGTLSLGARTETLHSVTMSSGELQRGGAALTLNNASSFTGGTVTFSATGSRINTTGETTFGAVTFSNTSSSTVTNAIVLGGDVATTGSGTTVFGSVGGAPFINLGATRTFNIASGTAMEVSWALRNGGLTKTGDGRLDLLTSAGTGMTAVTLSAGALRMGADGALGAASLALNNGIFASINSDARTITNALTIGGNVTLGQALGGTGALTFSNTSLGGGTHTITTVSAVNFVGAVTNGNLTKSGSAAMAFSNASTSFGTLTVDQGAAIFQANGTVTGLAGSAGSLTITNASTLTVNASANSTFDRVIDGNGVLAKSNTGTLTLGGANTYSGGTLVSAGTLAGTTGSLQGNITNNSAGGVLFDQTTTGTYAGIISGSGVVSKTNTGTVTLTGANSFSGALNVNGGTVVLNRSGGPALGGTNAVTINTNGTLRTDAAGQLVGAPLVTVNAGGTYNLNGFNQTNALAGAGNVSLGAATLSISNTGSDNFSGVASGAGGLTKIGSGVQTLSGANDYTGATTITAGELALGADNVIGDSSAVTINGGTFALGTRAETLNSIAMSDGALQRGGGTLTLTNSSSFTGGTVTLSATSSRINTAGTTTLGNVGVNYSSGSPNNNALVLGGGLLVNASTTANITNGGGGAVRLNLNDAVRTFEVGSAGHLNLDWVVWSSANASGGITKTGAGTVTLGQANLFTGGFTLSDGVVRAGNDAALGGSGGAVNLNGGTVASTDGTARTFANALGIGGDVTFGQASGGTGALTFSSTATNNLGGAARTLTTAVNTKIDGALGNGSISKAGDGTLSLSNASSSFGNLAISAGRVDFQTNATITGLSGSGGDLAISGGRLTVNASTNSSFGQAITGAGGLSKTGAGTLTLSASNNFAGTTLISGGTLAVNGTNTGSAVVISNGGTLGGTGLVAATTIQNGGLISPGNSIGTLSVETLTIDGGGGYVWEVADVTGAAGTDYDLISVGAGTGNVTFNATAGSPFTIYLTSFTGFTNWDAGGTFSWNIIDWGTVTGFDSSAFMVNTNDFSGTVSGAFTFANTNGFLVMSYADGTPTYDTNSGTWSAGFVPALANGNNVLFDGPGGNATNDISSATVASIGNLTFSNSSGSYTLSADSGSAGFDTASRLAVNGSIVNNSTSAQTINMALGFDAERTIDAAAGDMTFGGTISNGVGLIFTGVSNNTVSGVVSGAGTIAKTGTGTLVLSGANDYTGATTISNGVLQIGNATALGTTAAGTTVISGATLDLNGQAVGAEAFSLAGSGVGGNGALINSSASASSLSGAVTLTGNSTVGTTGNIALSGGISGAFSLTKIGAATLTLSGSSTYSGGTVISDGTVAIGNNSALGTGGVTLGNGSTIGATGALRTVANNLLADGDFTFGFTGGAQSVFNGNLDLGGFARAITLGFNSTNAATIGGVVSNGGINLLSTLANATLNLAGANTFSGPLNINGGTLAMVGDGSLNTAVAVDISRTNGNSRFDISGITADNFTVGSLAGANTNTATVNLGSKTLIAGGNNDSTTFGGVISNTGSFVKAGTGTMTLTGGNTYTGTTTISNGEIALSGSGALSASSALNLAGATSRFDISGITNAAGSTNASLAGVAGSVVNLGSKNLTVGGDNTSTTFAGILTNTGSLTKVGSGTMTLSGASTFSGGSTLSAGVLRVNTNSALGTGSLTQVDGTSTLQINAGGTIANNMSVYNVEFVNGGNTLSGTITQNNTTYDVNAGQTNTISAFVTGEGGIELIGGGQLNLTGATNDYGGATVISNGTLQISTLANAGTVSSIGTNGTIELDGATTSAAVIDYTGGSVSTDRTFALGGGTNGGGTLRIDDAATVVTATGSVTGEGTFVVDGPGTLVLSNTTANQFNPDAIQVNSGATLALGASEQLGNSTGLILNGGTLLVGASTLTENLGTLTLSASSTIDFNVFETPGERFITFNNSFGIEWIGTLTITNWQGVAQTSSEFTRLVFGVDGLDNDQLGDIVFASQGITGGELIGGGELVPVPEPRVYAAAVALLAVVGWRERKRLLGLLSRGKKPKV